MTRKQAAKLPAWLTGLLIRWALATGAVCTSAAAAGPAEPARPEALRPVLTNVLQVRQAMWRDQWMSYRVRLEGVVRWDMPGANRLFLEDSSGALPIPIRRTGPPVVLTGQRVRVEGECVAGQGLLRQAMVDNDSQHPSEEKSGSIYLEAGLYPVRLEWFNGPSYWDLQVDYQGPGCPRCPIPKSALFRVLADAPAATSRLVSGLDYRCYQGDWKRLPDFESLKPVKQGAAADFDLGVRTRNQKVGLVFTGYLQVPREGLYTFWVRSDDGSRLFVGERGLKATALGGATMSAPVPVVLGQVWSAEPAGRWAEAEGTVNFVTEKAGGLQLELSAGTGRLRVEVADSAGLEPLLLQNSRVRATGICEGTYTSDGQLVAGELLVPGSRQLALLQVPPLRWEEYPLLSIGRLSSTNPSDNPGLIVRLRGQVRSAQADGRLLLGDDTGQVQVQTSQPPPSADGRQIEVLGRLSRRGTNVVLESGLCRELPQGPEAVTHALPTLTTVDQIKRLDRAEAQRGYPVKIRGVVIGAWPYGAFSLQDATRAVYVEWPASLEGTRPRVGECWEVEGETFVGFAPNVRPRLAVRLGAGRLPEPLHPTWDQLSNGSLDTQYVEVQGIITALESDGAVFLTRSGKIRVQFPGVDLQTLRGYQNALVRVRGCLSPRYDPQTQQARVGQIRLFSASFDVEQPAAADPFAAPLKRAADLLLFDPQAGAVQRVKLAGQVLGKRGEEFYLLDRDCGVRFVPQGPVELDVGELVEVVGFAELGGPSPVLHEAVVRRKGRADLPIPQALSQTNFLNGRLDATLVRVSARLVDRSANQSEQVLVLQAGTREFSARLRTGACAVPALAPGSRLELTGVYAGRGGNRALGRDIDSFELLVNSPADLRVLERPSWWTLAHTLGVVGSMASVILAGLVWITLLRRKVEERSRQLAAAVRDHEQAERQRELEADRARIARDLHDDLGASLTGISLLADAGSGTPPTFEKASQRFRAIRAKARETVAALDVIVWLVNPRKDTLAAFATYLASYAEEYLSASDIACQLKIPMDLPQLRVRAEVRQCLFLAVKEALHNAVRHSRARQVELQLTLEEPQLAITVSDDGHGFDASAASTGDGLANLRERLAQLGGQCDIRSHPQTGTVVSLCLPLAASEPLNGESLLK